MSQSFLLDTNVLLDYADPDRAGHKTAFDLMNCALGQNAKLLITPCTLKDIYYIVIASEKRRIRASGAEPSPKECALINDYAFSLVESLTENITVLSDAPNDPRMAVKLRKIHPDFEDNLLLAAAMNVPGCVLVTNDQQLILHSPVGALSPNDALALLG